MSTITNTPTSASNSPMSTITNTPTSASNSPMSTITNTPTSTSNSSSKRKSPVQGRQDQITSRCICYS
jgi:hypothetical protein